MVGRTRRRAAATASTRTRCRRWTPPSSRRTARCAAVPSCLPPGVPPCAGGTPSLLSPSLPPTPDCQACRLARLCRPLLGGQARLAHWGGAQEAGPRRAGRAVRHGLTRGLWGAASSGECRSWSGRCSTRTSGTGCCPGGPSRCPGTRHSRRTLATRRSGCSFLADRRREVRVLRCEDTPKASREDRSVRTCSHARTPRCTPLVRAPSQGISAASLRPRALIRGAAGGAVRVSCGAWARSRRALPPPRGHQDRRRCEPSLHGALEEGTGTGLQGPPPSLRPPDRRRCPRLACFGLAGRAPQGRPLCPSMCLFPRCASSLDVPMCLFNFHWQFPFRPPCLSLGPRPGPPCGRPLALRPREPEGRQRDPAREAATRRQPLSPGPAVHASTRCDAMPHSLHRPVRAA